MLAGISDYMSKNIKKTHKCGKINEIKMKANSMKRINKNKYLSLTKKRKNISTFAIWNH